MDSHGVSHAALAVFNDELLQTSPELPSEDIAKSLFY